MTSFSYDALGRATNTLFPSDLSETYAHDNNGNLTSKTDRNGNAITCTCDAANTDCFDRQSNLQQIAVPE